MDLISALGVTINEGKSVLIPTHMLECTWDSESTQSSCKIQLTLSAHDRLVYLVRYTHQGSLKDSRICAVDNLYQRHTTGRSHVGTSCSKGSLRTATQEPLGWTDGRQRTYTSITLLVTTLPGCMKAIKQGSCYSSNHSRKLGQ